MGERAAAAPIRDERADADGLTVDELLAKPRLTGLENMLATALRAARAALARLAPQDHNAREKESE